MRFSLSMPQLNNGRYEAPTHIPMVYVTEAVTWEYKQITVEISDDEAISEEVLNELGREGWELTAVCPLKLVAHFYFKRIKQ